MKVGLQPLDGQADWVGCPERQERAANERLVGSWFECPACLAAWLGANGLSKSPLYD